MKKHLVLFLLWIPLFALGQKNSEPIDPNKVYKYQILQNDPENANKLSLTIFPVFAELNALNMHAGFQTGLSYRFKNFFSISTSFRRAYLQLADDVADPYSQHGFSIYENVKENAFQLHGKFYPVRKIKEVQETITLKSVGNTDYVANVPCERLVMYGGRIGFEKGIGLAGGENIFFHGVRVDSAAAGKEVFSGSDFSTMYEYTHLSLGASYMSITDIITQWVDFEGERKALVSTEVYFDVLLALNQQMDNMMIPLSQSPNNEVYNYHEFDVSGTPSSKLGFRLGFEKVSLRTFGASFGMEVGIRPSPVENTNLYLMMKLGMSLSALNSY